MIKVNTVTNGYYRVGFLSLLIYKTYSATSDKLSVTLTLDFHYLFHPVDSSDSDFST